MKSLKFGRKLKELREGENQTQMDLAICMSMTLRQIQRYEAGSVPRHDKLNQLSALYRFNFAKIISDESEIEESMANEEPGEYSALFNKTLLSHQATIDALQQTIKQQQARIKEKDDLLRDKENIIKELEIKLGKTRGRRSA